MPPVLFPLAGQPGPLGGARGGRAPQSRYSLQFDGSGYVTVPNAASLQTGGSSFAVACWVKLASLGNQGVITKWGSTQEYYLLWETSLFAFRALPNNELLATTYRSSGLPVQDTWLLMAAGYDAVAGELFIDVMGYRDTMSGVATTNSSADVLIGSAGATGHPNIAAGGRLDNAACFPFALSGVQVAALAAGTLDPATLTTAGLWRFEEGGGGTAADSSGNGNTGTLTGGVTFSADVPSQLA